MPRVWVQRMLVVIIAPIWLLSCAAETGPPGYQDGIRLAKLNLKSQAGSRYKRQTQRIFRKAFRKASRRCYVQIPDKRGATVLYRLDAIGDPVESIVYPTRSELAGCVLESAGKFKLPAPPEPDYWIAVRLVSQSR